MNGMSVRIFMNINEKDDCDEIYIKRERINL